MSRRIALEQERIRREFPQAFGVELVSYQAWRLKIARYLRQAGPQPVAAIRVATGAPLSSIPVALGDHPWFARAGRPALWSLTEAGVKAMDESPAEKE